MASEEFFCLKNSLVSSHGSMGMESSFGADAVRISLRKRGIRHVLNLFFIATDEVDWLIIEFNTNCPRRMLI